MILAEDIFVVRGKKELVSEATLVAKPGKVSVIVGPNGAGKSTLLKVLTGEIRADSGTVKLDDRSLNDISPEDLARQRGVLAQSTSLSFDFCVDEVVMLGRIPHLNAWESQNDRRAARAAIEAVEMQKFAHCRYTTLSGGEAQRVHLARVLAQLDLAEMPKNPDCARWLFLDEPTSALDLRHQHTTLGLVKKLTQNSGVGAIAVLHDLNLAMKYADHVVLMSRGKIAASGSAEDTLTPENISEVYGVEVETYRTADHGHPFLHIIEAKANFYH